MKQWVAALKRPLGDLLFSISSIETAARLLLAPVCCVDCVVAPAWTLKWIAPFSEPVRPRRVSQPEAKCTACAGDDAYIIKRYSTIVGSLATSGR